MNSVFQGLFADTQHRLHHHGNHHRLDAVKSGRHRRDVDVGHGQVAEQQHHEDGGDYEQGAGGDTAPRAVQPPADVGGQLLSLGSGQQHAEVECA